VYSQDIPTIFQFFFKKARHGLAAMTRSPRNSSFMQVSVNPPAAGTARPLCGGLDSSLASPGQFHARPFWLDLFPALLS
jgi:hypothetical protein